MTSLLDINPEDRRELLILDDGEYEVQILGMEDKQGPKTAYVSIRMEATQYPNADDIYHNLMPVDPNAPEKARVKRTNIIATFMQAFGLDIGDSINYEDMVGKRGYAHIGIEENEQYGRKNIVKKFIPAR